MTFQFGKTHFKDLLRMLQDFESVSDHFKRLWIKKLKSQSMF